MKRPHNAKMEELIKNNVNPERKKPRFHILDDDSAYVEKLRPYLDPYFQVFVSRFEIEEIAALIYSSDIVLISMDATFKLREFMGFFKAMMMKKKRSTLFHFFYLASTDPERNRMNAGSEDGGMAFSKEMDVARVADYFVKAYGKE